MTFPDISTHDGRRAWAFAAITGGGVFTLIGAAATGVYQYFIGGGQP